MIALVKRVLELINGEIQITSEEGKGSTFLVTLPVAGQEVRTAIWSPFFWTDMKISAGK